MAACSVCARVENITKALRVTRVRPSTVSNLNRTSNLSRRLH